MVIAFMMVTLAVLVYALSLPKTFKFDFNTVGASNLDGYCLANAIISFYLAGVIAICLIIGLVCKISAIN